MAKTYVHLVEPATEDDVESIAEDLKLGLSEKELEEYRELLNTTLEDCTKIQNIEEKTIPVVYPRFVGVKPPANSNSHNAWASKIELKGAAGGLLAGKKIAISDNIFIAGTPLQNGSKIWDGYTPEFDATVVTRILQAGGTIVGKSKCESQCYTGNSFTSISGPVTNPRDVTRSAGGSSSGSAALVATRDKEEKVDMALGGDQGGSVRMSACWTGCVGMKPTFGLVPVTGSIGMMPAVDHIGPMAIKVKDVALLLEVIAGYDDGRDHRQKIIDNRHRSKLETQQYSKNLEGNLSDMKFAYVKEGFNGVSKGVKKVMDKVIKDIEDAGATVDEISIPEHKEGAVIFTVLSASNYDNMIRSNGQASGYDEFYQVSAAKHISKSLKTQAHDLEPAVKAVSLFGEYLHRKDGGQIVARAMNMRSTLREAYTEGLKDFDALLMPTTPVVAPKLPTQGMSLAAFTKESSLNLQNTQMFNMTGHPSLSMKVGEAKPGDGGSVALPVGLMITGKHFDDAKVLDIAYGIEQLLA